MHSTHTAPSSVWHLSQSIWRPPVKVKAKESRTRPCFPRGPFVWPHDEYEEPFVCPTSPPLAATSGCQSRHRLLSPAAGQPWLALACPAPSKKGLPCKDVWFLIAQPANSIYTETFSLCRLPCSCVKKSAPLQRFLIMEQVMIAQLVNSVNAKTFSLWRKRQNILCGIFIL